MGAGGNGSSSLTEPSPLLPTPASRDTRRPRSTSSLLSIKRTLPPCVDLLTRTSYTHACTNAHFVQVTEVDIIEGEEGEPGSSTMGTLAGTAAGAVMAGGLAAAAAMGAPAALAAATLGAIVGAVAGGAMGKEVSEGGAEAVLRRAVLLPNWCGGS